MNLASLSLGGVIMNKSAKLSLLVGVVALLAGAFGVVRASPSAAAFAASGPASSVASLLSGTYRLKDDDTDVQLQLASIGGTGSTVDILATASGTDKGKDVHLQAVLRLASEGPDVETTVIPRSTPVTESSPDVTRFSETELQAACTLYLKPRGNGWAGETQGTATCVTGAAGKWQVDINPGSIRFTNPETKQVVVFHKA
jgi:hypothetical protein